MNTRRFLAQWRAAAFAVATTLTLGACGFLDPTEVENPSTTEDDLLNAVRPTAALLPGLRAAFATAINPVIPEVVSDNYSIHGTGINKTNDFPRQLTPDLIGGVYSNPQQLRSLTEFVLNDIIPTDSLATVAQEHEARYYYGMSFLVMGEWFAGVPIEQDGAPVGSTDLINRAISELGEAITADPGGDFALPAQAALARAHRLVGNAAEADNFASIALGTDPTFIVEQGYDPATITNGPFTFLYLRSLKEMQPLPRLDFLDPKYTAREAPIIVAKAEEMLLIRAEVAFSNGDYAAGRELVAQAVEVAQARPTDDFEDDDPRLDLDLLERPHDASITFRADASSPYRAGLVLTRPGTVTTPTVAATSLDADSIRAIAATEEESLLHAFFLARQEMLFLEGRRMADLGIKLPMSLTEIETNPSVNTGDLGTAVIVPSFVPAEDQMDLFTPQTPYDASGNLVSTQITGLVDVNRILAQNRVTPFGTFP